MSSTMGFQLRFPQLVVSDVDILNNIPVMIVDKIAETRGIYNRQAQTNTILFNIYANAKC